MVSLSDLDEVQKFIVRYLRGDNGGVETFQIKRAVDQEWGRRYPRWYHFFRRRPAVFGRLSSLQAQGVLGARWVEGRTPKGGLLKGIKVVWLTPHGDRLASQLAKQPDA